MKLKTIGTVLLILFAFSIGTSLAADTIANEQKTCPVMGGKIEGEGVVLKTVSTGDAHHDHEHDHGKKPGGDK